MIRFALLCFVAASSVALGNSCEKALQALGRHPAADELRRYEVIRSLELKATANFRDFRPEQGLRVTRRDGAGNAVEGVLRVLSDNPHNEIFVLSDANDWGRQLTEADRLRPVAGTPYFEGAVRGLRHGMSYRLRVNGRQLIDPASETYNTPEYQARYGGAVAYLNSIFWDADHPGRYRQTAAPVDLRGQPLIVAESEVYELVRKWDWGGYLGPRNKAYTYKFVAECGVIEELRRQGYNAIELLPFNSSADGETWSMRYQVFGLFGPDSRYGTPDEFAYMVDQFNRAGIAVIMDAVVGHYPFKANAGVRDLDAVGLHQWKKADGQNLYGSVWSPWGTFRYDYANPFVRRFLVDSVLTNLARYGISGIRFDNLDGIRFYEGPGGGGPEFLKELAAEVRRYRPETQLIGEMFFGENSVMQRLDRGGFGINMRTHSNLFDFFKDNLRKRTEEIDMNALRAAIRDPWHWGEAPRIQYPTNHDEAANPRDGATGSYPATLLNGGGWNYVEAKTKVYAALAMLSGSAYLDLPQMRLLQEGSFYSNPGVDWSLLRHSSQSSVYRYFSQVSWMVRNREAFAFHNFHDAIENHTDYDNKVISFLRIDHRSGKLIYCVLNLGHRGIDNYRVGVRKQGRYRLVSDSDRREFAGSNRLADLSPDGIADSASGSDHGKPFSIRIPYLAPYGVAVYEIE